LPAVLVDPAMLVETQEGLTERRETQDAGFPHSNEQRNRWRWSCGLGRPERVEPCDMDSDEKGSWGLWSQGRRAWC